MNTPAIKDLIRIIKTGSQQEVKEAQKALESYWHKYYIPHRKEGKKAFESFLDELKTFDQIKDIDHQAYFISSLKWAFWAIGEEYFETWAEFVINCIQHPSGKIRQSIIHITDILVISLYDVPTFSKKSSNKDKERNVIYELITIQRFGTLVMNIENLIQQYEEPKYKRYKYVSSLPVGIYKSLQILLTQKLLQSEYYTKMYDEFLHNMQMSQLKSKVVN